jgi:hypothetical protein
MPTIPSTTLTALEAALRTRIDGITPTHTTQQSGGWHYAEDRDMPAPSMVALSKAALRGTLTRKPASSSALSWTTAPSAKRTLRGSSNLTTGTFPTESSIRGPKTLSLA